MTEKELLRKEYLTKTALLTAEEKREASLRITDKLLELDIVKNAEDINIYLSFQNEVDTSLLIKKLIERNKKLSAPVLCGETLKAVCMDAETEFALNKYEIKEPIGKGQNKFDLIIVPLVAFDRTLTRLGRGKGYYDRFLNETNAFKLGIAFSVQEAEKIPCLKYDVKLDAVLTENAFFSSSNKRS